MRVITIATDVENPLLRRLLAPSCANVGLDLVILNPTVKSFTYADKRAILKDFLSRSADRDELVVFTDAYDTLFVRGGRYIEDVYRRFPQPVVFSAELNSWPMGVVGFALSPHGPIGRYPYLNSGGFVGRVGDLLDLCARYPAPPSNRFELLERLREHGYDADERFGFSDQYHWSLVQLLEPSLIGLDHQAEIFEYFGPPIPDVVIPEVAREYEEFCQQGRDSTPYKREHERLQARLREPSAAAQLHFASYISKAVILDLLDEGQLPDRIARVCEPGSGPTPQVYPI